MMAKPDGIIFTGQELKKYDGSNGVVFIAFLGSVYDVSHSFHWKRGFTMLCIGPVVI